MRSLVLSSLALALGACGSNADLPITASMGATPQLPAASGTLMPTVDVASAEAWTPGQKPVAAPGLQVAAFAQGLQHPRWLYQLPNGDVLAAESDAPPKPEGMKDDGGIRGWIQGLIMKKAGSKTPSADRITLLRDANGDGVAESRSVFLTGLRSPFGMTLVGDQLYIANADALVRVPYQAGQTKIDAAPVKVVDLPAGRNHHWTKNVVANQDGSKLYVTVGSNSNIGEHGMAEEEGRAAIWEVDPATGKHRIYAGGLRNPNGMAWEPASKALWTVVNERDEIGGDTPPDYLTSVQFGGFYGWPWAYWGGVVDDRVKAPRPGNLEVTNKPDYALGAHTASLGLTFATGQQLGPRFAEGAFIGQHGSWNRSPPSGYKVIFVPFRAGRPAGPSVDVLTGFRTEDDEARGRPVGVIVDRGGGLLVADDVGNSVWRVTGAAQTAQR